MFFCCLANIIAGNGRTVKKWFSIISKNFLYIIYQVIKRNIYFVMVSLVTLRHEPGKRSFIIFPLNDTVNVLRDELYSFRNCRHQPAIDTSAQK